MSSTHELGHNLTLHHSSSRDFGGEVVGPLGLAGTLDEYGDRLATMGARNLGFYNADHAISQLGWLNPTRTTWTYPQAGRILFNGMERDQPA